MHSIQFLRDVPLSGVFLRDSLISREQIIAEWRATDVQSRVVGSLKDALPRHAL